MDPDLRWHLSPERLYLDCWARAVLRDHVDPSVCAHACNVGIGRGGFDDWLGAWLSGHGTLVSVDIDARQVAALQERQLREGHPNPSQGVHADLLQANLGPFDLVTATGSTLLETHAPSRAMGCARTWVRPGGLLYITLVHDLADPDRLLETLEGIEVRETHAELSTAGATAVLIRCE